MIRELRENYRKAKAELKGEARSQARMIKNDRDIPKIAEAMATSRNNGPARSIEGVIVRMFDGDPMRFFDDGSLRHATGYKPGKATRKAAKKARQQRWKQSSSTPLAR